MLNPSTYEPPLDDPALDEDWDRQQYYSKKVESIPYDCFLQHILMAYETNDMDSKLDKGLFEILKTGKADFLQELLIEAVESAAQKATDEHFNQRS